MYYVCSSLDTEGKKLDQNKIPDFKNLTLWGRQSKQIYQQF